MAELGIASGIIGIIGFAIDLSKDVRKHIDAVKNARRDITELYSEVDLLSTVLINLQRTIGATDSSQTTDQGTSSASNWDALESVVSSCNAALKELKDMVEKFGGNGGRLSGAGQRFKWIFKKEDCEKLVANLHRYVTVFQSCSSTEGL